ncbi:MAG: cobalamin-dependent protein [Candidatus Aenigmarchaeota archaeon]|nr:cobalamin-dependent protein [Candidatus Aenigmarchaeota archaeon]
MKSILLINTPKMNYCSTKNNSKTELDIDNSYPIGLLSISSYIKHDNRFKVDYLDANFYHMDYNTILKKIKAFNPEYIALNMTFPNMHIVNELNKKIRNENPKRKIILGGPAATLIPEYLLKNSEVDYIVKGEGEETVLDLLNHLESKQDISTVKGIAYKTSGNKIITTESRKPLHMDHLPSIDVDNIPEEIKKYSKEVSLVTSRGCDSCCSFCSTPKIWGIGKKYLRSYSIDHIFKELENYEKKGFKFESVHFLDDNFTNDWDRVEEFMDKWNKTYKKKGKTWRCISKIKSINNQKRIDKMIDSGLTHISVGVESANPKILKSIGKGLKVKEVNKFQRLCKDRPIKIKGFFMIGFPNESEKDIIKTINYIEKSQFNSIGINIVMAYPGTRLYEQIYGKDKIFLPEYGDIDFSKIKTEEVQSIMKKYSSAPKTSLSKHVSIERLYELKELAYERFLKNR